MAQTKIDVAKVQARLAGRVAGARYVGKIDGLPGPLFWIALVGYAAPSAAPGGDAVTGRGRKLAEVAGEYHLDTAERIAGFLSNTTHETGDYRRLRENLYFTSAARIRKVWPTRFKTDADAAPFVRKAEALANRVYARPKEGNVNPGDGWLFRGGGDYQTTFRNGYRAAGAGLGLPLEEHPELIETPSVALLAGLFYWRSNRLARFYDAGQPKRGRALANAGDPDFPNPGGWDEGRPDDVKSRHKRIMEILV